MGVGLVSQGGWPASSKPSIEALVNSITGSQAAPLLLLLGGIIGLLLPRPRWLEASGRSGALLYITPPGLFFRRAALFFHGAYILREVWNYCTLPSSPSGFWSSLWGAVCGRGFAPAVEADTRHRKSGHHHHHHRRRHARHSQAAGQQGENIDWYVDRSDLQLFKDKIEKEDQSEAGLWEPMMDKDFGDFTYAAWRRKLPDGKTDYKSVTVASNATAEEFMDFYFDDHVRMKWDPMISQVEVLENGPSQHRCQVVRWIRTFPFAFLSNRDYVIARRMFKENGCLYGITKGTQHCRAPVKEDIVRMDTFYSMWRSRTIPDPKGGSEPACETVLLHREDFKIPENMARFAVKHGMSGFVKKLGPEVKAFVAERRQRCQPFDSDPQAFGVNTVPNPPTQLEKENLESVAGDDSASELSSVGTAQSARREGSSRGPRRRGLRKVLLAVAAVGAAAVVKSRRK